MGSFNKSITTGSPSSSKMEGGEQREQTPHFILIPWMAQGHFIPMLDIARLLLATAAARVTLVTTPANAARVSPTIDRLPSLRLFLLPFPAAAAGLPDSCESLDSLPNRGLARNFYNAAKLLRRPLEVLISEEKPSCIVAGVGFPWLADVAAELGVPRLVFQGFSCFSLLCTRNLEVHRTHETVCSPEEKFFIPGLPCRRPIEITRHQLPRFFDTSSKFQDIYQELHEGESSADGMVVNSFDELEPGFDSALAAATGQKVWTIGPVSLSTDEKLDVAQRGNKPAVDEQECLRWLDMKPEGSVIYVSFGSMGRLPQLQLAELGAGLEASGRPFIWVIRAGEDSLPMEQLLAGDVKESCLLIQGWAPQLMILFHPAIGCFVTHCGWNSTLEAVAAGVPVLTWPLGADQFLNEKLLVEVVEAGVSAGAKAGGGEEEKGNNGAEVVSREKVAEAIEILMGDGAEGKKRRERAKELGKMARRAVNEGGSSFSNLYHLVKYVSDLDVKRRSNGL